MELRRFIRRNFHQFIKIVMFLIISIGKEFSSELERIIGQMELFSEAVSNHSLRSFPMCSKDAEKMIATKQYVQVVHNYTSFA